MYRLKKTTKAHASYFRESLTFRNSASGTPTNVLQLIH
jgi:hypothetical protein